MRFLPNVPDIPAELIAAQEKGETLFICGAGVSRTVGLPLFRGLVKGVYQELGEDWRLHPAEHDGIRSAQYDRRALAILEKSFGPDHPNVGMVRDNLASLMKDTNRQPKAETT